MNLVEAVLATAEDGELPAQRAVYEYVVAAGGLCVRGSDRVISALVPVAYALRPLTGLSMVLPEAKLLVPRVSERWLLAILQSARSAMPAEAMYQLVYDDAARNSLGGWACARPVQRASPGHVTFLELSGASVDLHSHHSMGAFFSATDDADEQGLRFYCVIGRLDTDRPQIAARVGVYGHVMPVPALTVFDGIGPFADTFSQTCRSCGCTEGEACDGGCWWVEDDLCSACAGVE